MTRPTPAAIDQNHSILYRRIESGLCSEQAEMPEFFRDLNLDQVIAAVTAGKDEYNLPILLLSAPR